jgi:hypothetical protein
LEKFRTSGGELSLVSRALTWGGNICGRAAEKLVHIDRLFAAPVHFGHDLGAARRGEHHSRCVLGVLIGGQAELSNKRAKHPWPLFW